MTQPKYFTIESWKEAPGWWQMTIRSLFYRRCVERLGYGAHEFESAADMLAALGMEHVPEPGVQVRNVRFGKVPSAVKSPVPLFRLSYRAFARLEHESPNLRLQRQCWPNVRHEGAARYVLIVS